MEKRSVISLFPNTKALQLVILLILLHHMIKLGTIFRIQAKFQSFLSNGLLIFVQPVSKIFSQIGLLNKSTNAMMLYLRRKIWALRWTQRLQPSSNNLQRLVVSSFFTFINRSFIFNIVLNGAGVNMLKVGSKRRRTKREIEEEN